MNKLDSLPNADPRPPLQAAGGRARKQESAGVNTGSGEVQLLTPSGNALPPQAKPALQSAIQRVEQAPAEELQSEDVQAVVEQLESFTQSLQRSLSFSVDDITGKTVLTVTDSESEEIVRQIPSEEVIQLARKLQELQEMQQQLNDSTGNLLQVKV